MQREAQRPLPAGRAWPVANSRWARPLLTSNATSAVIIRYAKVLPHELFINWWQLEGACVGTGSLAILRLYTGSLSI